MATFSWPFASAMQMSLALPFRSLHFSLLRLRFLLDALFLGLCLRLSTWCPPQKADPRKRRLSAAATSVHLSFTVIFISFVRRHAVIRRHHAAAGASRLTAMVVPDTAHHAATAGFSMLKSTPFGSSPRARDARQRTTMDRLKSPRTQADRVAAFGARSAVCELGERADAAAVHRVDDVARAGSRPATRGCLPPPQRRRSALDALVQRAAALDLDHPHARQLRHRAGRRRRSSAGRRRSSRAALRVSPAAQDAQLDFFADRRQAQPRPQLRGAVQRRGR